jgi:hypothetical protein
MRSSLDNRWAFRAVLLSVCLWITSSGVVHGDLINLPASQFDFPNLYSTSEAWGSAAGVSYTVVDGVGHFHAEGMPQSYSVDKDGQEDIGSTGVGDWPADQYFSIDITLTPTGTTPSVCSGTMTVVGSLGGVSGVLLQGEVVQMGALLYTDPNTGFETSGFDFLVRLSDDCLLKDDYGSMAYIQLSPRWDDVLDDGLKFTGSMAGDFTFSGIGDGVDIFSATVPEPSVGALAMSLMTTGLGFVSYRRFRTRRCV